MTHPAPPLAADPRRHLFAEKNGRYDLRCVYCDRRAFDAAPDEQCQKAPRDSEIRYE